jgi:hypothetical protein
LALLSLITVVPLLENHKSFVPFCRDISNLVPGTARLYAYQPDETLRGAVPFYTGKPLKELQTIQSLSEIGGQDKPAFVAVRDKKGRLEADILGTGWFSVVSKYGSTKDRSLVLFKNGAAVASENNK